MFDLNAVLMLKNNNNEYLPLESYSSAEPLIWNSGGAQEDLWQFITEAQGADNTINWAFTCWHD